MHTMTLLILCLVTIGVVAKPQFYPHPYLPPLIPPGFDKHLPLEAKQKLIQLHYDRNLTFEQRRQKIEEVLDGLTIKVLEKLPLPPGLERLPEDSKARFKKLVLNRKLSWQERDKLIQEEIKKLPEEQQRLVEPPRHPPPMPPPFLFDELPRHPPTSFESILPPTIFKQLVAVYSNLSIDVDEKKRRIDKIMSTVNQNDIDRLPLPSNLYNLSSTTRKQLEKLIHNFQIDWDLRQQNVFNFIKSLSLEERQSIRSPPPPGFDQLPMEIQDQIDRLFINEHFTPLERQAKINNLLRYLSPPPPYPMYPPPPPYPMYPPPPYPMYPPPPYPMYPPPPPPPDHMYPPPPPPSDHMYPPPPYPMHPPPPDYMHPPPHHMHPPPHHMHSFLNYMYPPPYSTYPPSSKEKQQ